MIKLVLVLILTLINNILPMQENLLEFNDLPPELKDKIFGYALKADKLKDIICQIISLSHVDRSFRFFLILDKSLYLINNVIKDYCKNRRNKIKEMLKEVKNLKNILLVEKLIFAYKKICANFDKSITQKNPILLLEIIDNNNLSLLKIIYKAINNKSKIERLFDEYLKIAVKNNYINMANFLIKKNANVNKKDFSGYTHLINATYMNNKEMLLFLIKKGANLNERNNYGSTALIIAIEYNYAEMAEILLKNGADVNLRDGWGTTALDRAKKSKNQKILALLSQYEN